MKGLFTVLALFIINWSFGQISLKAGGYSSSAEVIEANPKYNSTFSITKRSQGDIAAWGGGDYKIAHPNLSSSIIKKEILAISDGDSIYFNGKMISGRNGYLGVIEFGEITVINSTWPTNKIADELDLGEFEYSESIKNAGLLVGGAVSGAATGKELALARVPIVLDLVSGDKMKLSKKTLLNLIKNRLPALFEELEEEENPDFQSLISYVRKANVELK